MPKIVHAVVHDQVEAFEALGWAVDDELTDCHNGRDSVIMTRRPRPGESYHDICAEVARMQS
ncbi:MAG: hypothetical protein ACF8R7_18530 [Phycisphaerales bacterium JB039]